MIESFTTEQVASFERDGFVIVEEGLVSERGLELLRERYVLLFDCEYETGIRPDEVNWVPGRDPEDRTRQLCNAWKSDNVVAAQVLSKRTGRLAAQQATAACASSRTTSSGSRRGRRRSASTRIPRTRTTSYRPR